MTTNTIPRNLQIACFITGDDVKLLHNDTPASKKKVTMMALAILLPVTLWIISGYNFGHNILEADVFSSCLIALAMGVLIFIVEKMILMSSSLNTGMKLFRVTLGLLTATFGSVIFDEMIFRNDINREMSKLKQELVAQSSHEASQQFSHMNKLELLNNRILNTDNALQVARHDVNGEVDGSSGTRNAGHGDATDIKIENRNQILEDRNGLEAERIKLETQQRNIVEKTACATEASYNNNALLLRIKVLFKLISTDKSMLFIYIIITGILFSMEFLVLLFKMYSKKTSFEKRMEYIDEIVNNRISYLQKEQSSKLDPVNYSNQYSQIRNLTNQQNGLFFKSLH